MKSDQMDMMGSDSLVATASTVVSSAGTKEHDTSQTSSATRHSTYTTNCSGGVGLRTSSDADADSEMSARYADTYSYDGDCEPLELGLSLELAHSIVGSTRSDAKP
ncbi:hypothetical protein FGIG_09478 [Fasciola gigantica]|uniref:Uncharacterized protein n=1 Tax=Fasciola gigantica TaxID=46835 RepID=A0A504YZT3_FASGI|nr:hypothetical protein FGIG_09478 [Fasciola gigantica]